MPPVLERVVQNALYRHTRFQYHHSLPQYWHTLCLSTAPPYPLSVPPYPLSVPPYPLSVLYPTEQRVGAYAMSIGNVSTGQRVGAWEHLALLRALVTVLGWYHQTLAQYWTSHRNTVAPYTRSVPDVA
eukprot:477525-Rhodomonas_salina.1